MTPRTFVREFPAVHLAIGVLGNVIFVGSVLFLWPVLEMVAIWLFCLQRAISAVAVVGLVTIGTVGSG